MAVQEAEEEEVLLLPLNRSLLEEMAAAVGATALLNGVNVVVKAGMVLPAANLAPPAMLKTNGEYSQFPSG